MLWSQSSNFLHLVLKCASCTDGTQQNVFSAATYLLILQFKPCKVVVNSFQPTFSCIYWVLILNPICLPSLPCYRWFFYVNCRVTWWQTLGHFVWDWWLPEIEGMGARKDKCKYNPAGNSLLNDLWQLFALNSVVVQRFRLYCTGAQGAREAWEDLKHY